MILFSKIAFLVSASEVKAVKHPRIQNQKMIGNLTKIYAKYYDNKKKTNQISCSRIDLCSLTCLNTERVSLLPKKHTGPHQQEAAEILVAICSIMRPQVK